MRLALILFVAALAVGCGKKKDEAKKEPPPAPMPTEPTTTAPEQPTPPAETAPPTEEDFEATAQQEITKDNLDSQLKSIEKDLGE